MIIPEQHRRVTTSTLTRIKLSKEQMIDLLLMAGIEVPRGAEMGMQARSDFMDIDDYPFEISWKEEVTS